MHCRWDDKGILRPTMPMGTNVKELVPLESLERAFEQYVVNFEKGEDLEYIDTHCWTFIPDSLHLILLDLAFINEIKLGIEEIVAENSSEFFVKLAKKDPDWIDSKEFYEKRQMLMHKVAAFYRDQS